MLVLEVIEIYISYALIATFCSSSFKSTTSYKLSGVVAEEPSVNEFRLSCVLGYID
jgi:hypothetical protein